MTRDGTAGSKLPGVRSCILQVAGAVVDGSFAGSLRGVNCRKYSAAIPAVTPITTIAIANRRPDVPLSLPPPRCSPSIAAVYTHPPARKKRPHDERCRAAWRRRKRGLSRSRVRVKGNNPPCSSHTTADFALSRCVDRRLPSLLAFTSARSMLLSDVLVRSGLGTMSRLFKPSFANSTPLEA